MFENQKKITTIQRTFLEKSEKDPKGVNIKPVANRQIEEIDPHDYPTKVMENTGDQLNNYRKISTCIIHVAYVLFT